MKSSNCSSLNPSCDDDENPLMKKGLKRGIMEMYEKEAEQ